MKTAQKSKKRHFEQMQVLDQNEQLLDKIIEKCQLLELRLLNKIIEKCQLLEL
jgi:hypothetical protein